MLSSCHFKFEHSQAQTIAFSVVTRLLVVLKNSNLHPVFVQSPSYHTNCQFWSASKIWVFRQQNLGSSVSALSSHVEGFLFSFVELVTIPHLHVSSSELLVPRSRLRNQVLTRHSSCRVYPPQLSTTTVVWVGASYHSRTNSLQYTRWQSGDCPTDHTRCQTRDENAHRVTARRL